jgi:prepilin-type processing-associated H-X9-DG protein
LAPGADALGSYNYNAYSPGFPMTGVFPVYTTPQVKLRIHAAMSDGISNTIIAGEQVQVCGGMGMQGNPWGTYGNRRVMGNQLMPNAIALGVNKAACTPPPGPPPGRASFASPHPTSTNFLMGDGSVHPCSKSVDISTVLVPALTGSYGDQFPGF